MEMIKLIKKLRQKTLFIKSSTYLNKNLLLHKLAGGFPILTEITYLIQDITRASATVLVKGLFSLNLQAALFYELKLPVL